MDAIISSLISAAAALGSVWLSHYLSRRRADPVAAGRAGKADEHGPIAPRAFILRWIAATLVAVVADFVVFEAWAAYSNHTTLLATHVLMGAILGITQWIILRRHLKTAWLWIPATAIFGTIAVQAALYSGSIALCFIALVLFGLANLLLGPVLVWASNRERAR